MKPLITALIDTYNHERYIEEAIVSALEQGLSPEELDIVVVDDGSTDRTPEIIQKFVPRVKLLRKKNGGQASAFNAGFAEARGEIVALLDGDDWWARGKIAAVADALETKRDVVAVGHGYYEFDQQTEETRSRVPDKATLINLTNREAAREALPSWRYLLMGALTIRRNVLKAIMPIPNAMVFMADTAIQAAAMAGGALILPGALFYYRQHANNLYAQASANGGASDDAKLRRKYEMTDLVYGHVNRMLLALNVPKESVSELLDGIWAETRRARLSRFGGSRWQVFQAEMQNFRAEFRNPSVAYRIFKYAVMTGSMLLPARRFYQLRNWYADKNMRRFRDLLWKTRH